MKRKEKRAFTLTASQFREVLLILDDMIELATNDIAGYTGARLTEEEQQDAALRRRQLSALCGLRKELKRQL